MHFTHLVDRPIIHVSDSDTLAGNVNGPSLIRVPDWVENPLGRYYVYFAHHEGDSIRLAYADDLRGDWTIYDDGALSLRDSLFPTVAPKLAALHPEAKRYIKLKQDGYYPHIASPDVIVDHDAQQIRLYYHGRLSNGLQRTRVALSSDGLNFVSREPLLGNPYMRIFQHDGAWFGIGMPGILYRSMDGLSDFVAGQTIMPDGVRHVAVLQWNERLLIFWTRAGDKPEHILLSEVNLSEPYQTWQATHTKSVHKPLREWEGAMLPTVPSHYGGIMKPVNQLRDPYAFVEDKIIYLLYAVAGEQGIGIGKLMLE